MFWGQLVEVEKVVSRQEETFTLFDLNSRMGEWPRVFGKLYHCHRATVRRSESRRHRNWQKALVLLSGLHGGLMAINDSSLFDYFLNIFLKTCFPYLRITGVWLSEGRLEDFRDEFPFAHRVEDRESEDFWTEGMEARDYSSFLKEEGLSLPDMFESCFGDVLVSGKSVEILTILRRKRVIRNVNNNFNGDTAPPVLETFLKEVVQHLQPKEKGKDEPDLKKSDGQCPPTFLRSESSFDTEDLDMDPYLILAFQEVCGEGAGEDEIDVFRKGEDNFFLVRGVDPLQPVGMVLSRCLSRIVSVHYRSSCDALSHLVLGTLDLERHLANVRKVQLMEAGDLMHEFYRDLFRRAETGLDLDSTSVTLFLQDCLARRDHELADRFAVILPEDSPPEECLKKLEMTYEVSWPLSIVLSRKSLGVYNRVFLFLLEVKRALWSLHMINAKDLIAQLTQEEERLMNKTEVLEDDFEHEEEHLTPSLRMHRVLLLRSWLLHFVGSVHSYFMSRVLHTTELELREALRQCSDLDQILAAHSEYLGRIFDRCFLHPSARVLREAVTK